MGYAQKYEINTKALKFRIPTGDIIALMTGP